jgi:hypothetical protein
MTCQRARDVEMAAYLADPTSSEWREFRAHFPECEDCSRVVAEWTAFETTLEAGGAGGDAHPDPEKIATWAESPASLARAERDELSAHVESCRTCADEAAAIRAFDFARLEQGAPEASGGGLRKLGESLRRLGSTLLGSGPDASDRPLGEGIFTPPEPQLVFQSAEGASETGDSDAAPAGVLVALGGDLEGEVFPLSPGETRVGRGPDCRVRLRGVEYARLEASIRADAGGIHVTSHNRRNPVLVNGAPATSDPIGDGDRLQVGLQGFEVRLPTGER